jgi:hypothetical protein
MKKFTLQDGNISKTKIIIILDTIIAHVWPRALDAYKLVSIVKLNLYFGNSTFIWQ